MTTLDEALRALEKKWREHGERQYQLADATGLSEGEMGWHNGRSEQADDCADELAALLSSRQEAAPVAWGVMYPADDSQHGQLWNVAVEKKSAEEMQAACWNAGDDLIVPLYTSPAHTSEARDAARYQWLVERGFVFRGCESVVDGYIQGEWFYRNHGADAAVDAAMRQEAGSGE